MSETIQSLLAQYGYLAVLVGSLLEGETVLVLAGFAAHRGYLDLPLIMLIAALGGFLGDQLFFLVGRWHGRQFRARFPSVETQAARVDRLIERHTNLLILGVRFMYGLRIAGPVLLGMSPVHYLHFALLNLLGALIWSVLITGGGYLFGQAVEMVLQDVRRYEIWVLAVIVVVGAVVWWRRRQRAQRAAIAAQLREVGKPNDAMGVNEASKVTPTLPR